MIEDSKTIFITHPYFAVNNPTNNYRIYFKKRTLIHGVISNVIQKVNIELR